MNDETVVLLGWKGVDEYAYIDYRPEHALKERGRATYKEIKEYVEEKYGLRVTSLNIAQVKDKCGIKERENYHKGSENHRIPQVTEEKEEAIKEAFRHFRLIK